MNQKTVNREIQTKSALHKLKRKIPYGWDLNLYRGCSHSCVYCYAIYTHQYLNCKDFSGEIFVKTNLVETLERELSNKNWKREVVNIGGVTDSYQPAEKQYQLMPGVLKLLIKYKTPAIISSKSNLILRDYDLIEQLSRITYVNLAQTITTCDDSIRSFIEPGAASTTERFEVLKFFRKTNASIGLHVMPIIPHLTDHRDNLEELCQRAKDCEIDYLLSGTLYLRGATRSRFFDFIEKEFPGILKELKTLYKTGGADKAYKNKLYELLNGLRDIYNISSSYMKPMREKLDQS